MTNTSETQIMTSKYTGIFGSTVLLAAVTIFAGNATASTVTVDGIKSAGEYTGPSSGSKNLLWYNEHNSIYTEAAGNMNPLVWEISGAAGDVSLNLFFEVPTDARRMIWEDGCKSDGSGCTLDPVYLAGYQAGTHKSEDNMDYGNQTSSEFFELHGVNTGGTGGTLKKKWQDEDGDNSITSAFNWSTSREYLLDPVNGPICTEALCEEYDRTASFEVEWTGLADAQAAKNIRDAVTKMELHLSDEAVGLPDMTVVPVPAAFWLFGTALIGFIGFSRRTNLS